MASTSKNLLYVSSGIVILVALAALVDIFLKKPFAGQVLMDIFFIIGAVLTLLMAWESFKEQA